MTGPFGTRVGACVGSLGRSGCLGRRGGRAAWNPWWVPGALRAPGTQALGALGRSGPIQVSALAAGPLVVQIRQRFLNQRGDLVDVSLFTGSLLFDECGPGV